MGVQTLGLLNRYALIMSFGISRPLAMAVVIAVPVLSLYSQRSLAHLSAIQQRVSLLLRTLFLLLVSAALAGSVVTMPSRQTAIVAAVDVSRSIAARGAANIGAFHTAAAQRNADWRVVRFAGEPEAVDPVTSSGGGLTSPQAPLEIDRSATNIAAALVAARAMIPADRAGKIVLFSDGNATSGDAVAAAKAVGVPVWTVPLPSVDPEFAVTDVDALNKVRAGEEYVVEIRVQATQPGDVAVELLNDGKVVAQEKRTVAAGESSFRFSLVDKQPAIKIYVARIVAAGDTLSENNLASCGICIWPRPNVLVVARQPVLAEQLKEALVHETIDVDVRTPDRLPAAAQDLHAYDAVILSNLPAGRLPAPQMKALVEYVHDDGGGLIVLGGDSAFTAGGYRGTALEDALPVISEVKKDRPRPTMAMVLVLDISGSMEGRSIDLAKQALSRAVDKLGPRDLVGVLVFEDQSRWIAPLGPTKNKERILAEINAIKAEGGTTMYPAMERAYLALHNAPTDRKHIIVMTDGVSNPSDFDALARQINADGISISMVGVGGEPARPLLQGIADTAKGRAYFCDDVAALPKIFETETLAAGRPGVTEERFIPKVAHNADLLRGTDFSQAPLLGYVATQARAESDLILATKNDEPLLAAWRYGRGTSVAFTSDVQSDWAGVWFTWRGFDKFWAQLVRHSMRKEPPPKSLLGVTFSSGLMHLTFDAIDLQGQYLNSDNVVATAADSTGRPMTRPMTMIAPGRYAADFPATPGGVYRVFARLSPKEQPVAEVDRYVAVPYDDEYRVRPTNVALLKQIADVSGGKFDPQPDDVLAAGETVVPVTHALPPYFLMAAAVVLLLDLLRKRW